MAEQTEITSVERTDDYYHVRYRDPDEFSDIRTPDWAAEAAGSVAPGGEVRMGNREGSDEWAVQSVLVPADGTDEGEARSRAEEIVGKIES